jgi:hypothetical protein
MKNIFARLFRKEPVVVEDWRLVHTAKTGWERTSKFTDEVLSTGFIFFHFFESDRGNRYITMSAPEVTPEIAAMQITVATLPKLLAIIRKDTFGATAQTLEFAVTNKDWNNIIFPWLAGRHDPQIPTYESIPRKEFRDQLAGKKV